MVDTTKQYRNYQKVIRDRKDFDAGFDLYDPWALGISDPNLPNGTNSEELLAEARNSIKAPEEIFASSNFNLFPDSYLIINDTYLTNVPAASISINSTTDVFVGETLRSQAPVVDSEGRQDFVLRLSLAFPPGAAQEVKLRRIMSQITRHPFVYVHNNNIKQKLALGEFDTTIFVLEAATLRSTVGTVGLVILDMQLHYFNHKPFSKHFYYNAKLPGYSEEPNDAPSYNDTEEIDISEFGGYEASDHTLSKLAERTRNKVRREITNLEKSKRQNVPVNLPSESDAWMYYANHLETQSPVINGIASDFVGFTLRKYYHFNPPEKQTESQATLSDLMNQRYKSIDPIYQPKGWKKSLGEAVNKSTRSTASTSTAQDKAHEQARNVGSSDLDPTRKIKFTNQKGQSLSISLVDENNKVTADAILALTRFADKRRLTAHEDVYLNEKLIRHIFAVANHFPGRTIQIISTQRDPGWVKKKKPKPAKWTPSKHITGHAMDFRVRGIPNRDLYEFIKSLSGVGAGYYPNSVFCHMDARSSNTYWIDKSGVGENSDYLIETRNIKELNKVLYGNYGTYDNAPADLVEDAEEIRDNMKEERKKQTQDIAKDKGDSAKQIQDKRNIKEDKTDPKPISKKQKAKKSLEARTTWIESIEKEHGVHYFYNDPSVRNVFYKDIERNVSSDRSLQRANLALSDIVCSSISISFGHRIAQMRLLSQEHYTYQFLGAGNKSGQMVFVFAGKEGRESANQLKELFYKARDNARDFTSIIKSVGTIGLKSSLYSTKDQNVLLDLVNVKNVIITNVQEANSPDGADKHQLTIEFIVQDFAEEKLEEKFATTLDTKQRIIKSILSHVVSKPSRINRTTGDLANEITLNSQIGTMNRSGVGGAYKVAGDTPTWVTKIIGEASEICQEANDNMPPIIWKVADNTSLSWTEVYKNWGAAGIMKGKLKNIYYTERNSKGQQADIDYELQVVAQKQAEKSGTKIDFKDRLAENVTPGEANRNSINREFDGILDKSGGPKTNKVHRSVFDVWLSKMNILAGELQKHTIDGEAMDRYFPDVMENIQRVIAGDISSCYMDVNLPVVPGTIVPLPPEFYIYDDSHEDPLVSSMTDENNMERFLKRHVETEFASVENYINNAFLGGSYISKNLPRILENRASEHERSEGERSFARYWNYFSTGASSWEPIYTRKDKQESAIQGVKDWQIAVAENYGNGTDKEQRLSFLNNVVNLSPYIRSGRQWVTPLEEKGNSDLVRSLYGDAEERLAFGPNPLYGGVDAALMGRLEDPSKERLAQAIENKAAVDTLNNAARTSQVKSNGVFLTGKAEAKTSIDFAGGRTVSADGAVTVGQTKEEKEAMKTGFFDEAFQMGKDLVNSDRHGLYALGAGVLLAPFTAGTSLIAAIGYSGSKIVYNAVEAYGNIVLDKEAAKYEHSFSKLKENEEAKQIAQAATKTALGKRKNDLSMRRAYPTFKIFFIEDDSGDTELVDEGVVRAFDDFYSYSAVQEIKITRSRHIASDLAVIRITNIGGLLLRKRFGDSDKDNPKYGIGAEKQGIFADTEYEHPFEKMVLQDGVKCQIRLGYAANADNLETVFLGQIVEVSLAENGKIIEIMCQGYGAELESVELGPLEDGPYFLSSQQALSGAIIQDSIANFGRQDRFQMDNPAALRHRWTGGRGMGLLSGLNPSNILSEWSERGLDVLFNRYQFKNFQQDDNIYAPPPDVYASTWEKFWNNACIYRPLKQTPWEIFKEHELRHPGYISLAVPYGHSPRMTMFFGSKMQHYWSKPPSALEIELSRGAKNEIVRLRKQGIGLLQKGLIKELVKLVEKSPKLGSALFNDIMTVGTRYDTGFALGELFGRYVPFRNYHYFDSSHHILKNEIRTSVDGTFNEVEIYYTANENSIINADKEELKNENVAEDLLAVKLDENIPESSIRSYRGEYPSCVTVDMARRYVQGIFGQTLRDAYKGELCIIGDEKVKPYDVCYLNDSSINMSGPIEVEAVTHIFNRDIGFVSIITPDLCVEVNDYYTATVTSVTSSAMNLAYADGIATPAWAALKALSYPGLSMYVKFMLWSQEGAPVMATPLMLGGKPFISNSIGSNRVSLFTSVLGKWNQYWDDFDDAWRKFDLSEAMFQARIDFTQGIFEFFGEDASGSHKEA